MASGGRFSRLYFPATISPSDVIADDVQIRVLLAGERCRRKIFRCRARAHGIRGAFVAESTEGARDLVSDVFGDGRPFNRAADLGGR